MNTKNKTNTETILMIMHVLVWIAFIGLMIEAGAILVSYGVSVVNEQAAMNLYKGQNWYPLRAYNFWHYTGIISLKVAITILEAYSAYLVIKVLSSLKIANPFTMDMANHLEKIAHMIIVIWVVTLLYNGQLKWLSKDVSGLQEMRLSTDSIFYAGLVFIVSKIFRKGAEIQAENELTV